MNKYKLIISLIALITVSSELFCEESIIPIITTFGGRKDDYAYYVGQTEDGGYIILGTTSSLGSEDSNMCLIKTDETGEELWHRVYGGPDNDYCFNIQETSDSGYIFTGFIEPYGTGNTDIFLIKTDTEGNIEF